MQWENVQLLFIYSFTAKNSFHFQSTSYLPRRKAGRLEHNNRPTNSPPRVLNKKALKVACKTHTSCSPIQTQLGTTPREPFLHVHTLTNDDMGIYRGCYGAADRLEGCVYNSNYSMFANVWKLPTKALNPQVLV